ncbi:MAG: ribonuclease HIII [Candidatus Gastranaerophilaceae bacterium]
MDKKYIAHIGTDESGKGDFFGPLVIAGVLVDEKSAELFKSLGIKDSKTITDKRILEMSEHIKKHSAFSVIAIGNARYNELYKNFANLNKLLAWGHAKVIENILEKNDCEYALSDKFGDESLILNALQTKGRGITLKQMVRAESDIAVAAASVLARATFVQKMAKMEQDFGCKFPKGCSSLVKTAAAEFISMHGSNRLNEVCKTHFKTYKEVLS